jgi:hypothetical protein
LVKQHSAPLEMSMRIVEKNSRLKLFSWILKLYIRTANYFNPCPTYPLIFPEKNHGILAGEYDPQGGMIRVEANSLLPNFLEASSCTKLFFILRLSLHFTFLL